VRPRGNVFWGTSDRIKIDRKRLQPPFERLNSLMLLDSDVPRASRRIQADIDFCE
jgi:hypothetical protein